MNALHSIQLTTQVVYCDRSRLLDLSDLVSDCFEQLDTLLLSIIRADGGQDVDILAKIGRHLADDFSGLLKRNIKDLQGQAEGGDDHE